MLDENRAEFLRTLSESLQNGSFIKVTLGKYRGNNPNLKNTFIRLVQIKNTNHLSFLYRYQTKDVVKNHLVDEGLDLIGSLLGDDFRSGHLFTLDQNLQIEFSKKLKSRLVFSKPSFTEKPEMAHDEKKKRFIDLQSNYLRALGVTNERGEIRERMGDKWRQINKFVEIVSSLYHSSDLPAKKEISILDMGSGKGYLTFAVYDYFNNVLGVKADVTGVEVREDLVEFCNDVARESGFSNLRFQRGYIRDYEVNDVDILIALHACNTATDEAIYKGVSSNAQIIICAPCCHKQIRPQITPPPTLRGILRFGILLERQAEMATDALRALLLEYSGYAVKVFEFVSTEHTHKNTMITGVRQSRNIDKSAILTQINDIKGFYGINEHYLEHLLFNHSAQNHVSISC